MGERIALFPSSRPTLTGRNAREYYGHRPDFQKIVERIGAPDNRKKLMEKIEAELARDQHMILLKQMSIGARCALGLPIILGLFKVLSLLWVFAVLIGIVVVLSQINGASDKRRKMQVDKYTDSLQRAEDRDIELINGIESEWDTYCVDFPGYPPDWNYRKLVVHERDHHTCSECGWPEGVKRMVRELHLHHIEPLSRGGSNALSNLVTLCDICHRRQEGAGHARINPRRRKKKGSADM